MNDLSDIPSREDWERAQETKRQALDALFFALPSWEDWSRAQVPIEEDAEKAKRRAAVQSADKKQKCKLNKTKENRKSPVSSPVGRQRRWETRANSRCSGHFPSPFLQSLDERFIDGELSTEDVIAELDRHYGIKRK